VGASLSHYAARETQPGAEVDAEAHVRATARGFFHPTGTCAIGSVVDERRVYGYENLVVADASIMPTIPRVNTNLTTKAIAAKLVRELGAVVEDGYEGRAERVWTDASDGADLQRRLESLPGFGKMKVTSLGAVLAKRFGVEAAQELVPNHPTLGDVDSPQALE